MNVLVGDESTGGATTGEGKIIATGVTVPEVLNAAILLGIAVRAVRERELKYQALAEGGILDYLREVKGTEDEGIINTGIIAERCKVSRQDVQIAVGALTDSGRLISHHDFKLSISPDS